jgi:transposase
VKIHAIVDALDNPLRICLTGGHVHDISPAYGLISELSAEYLLADKAYDAEEFIAIAHSQGSTVVIPPKSNRLVQRDYDQHIYKERHLVECFFAKLKKYRRIATRYDKLALTFRAVVMIAACLIWLQ